MNHTLHCCRKLGHIQTPPSMNVMFNIAKYDAGVYKHKATEEAIGQSSLSLVQRIP